MTSDMSMLIGKMEERGITRRDPVDIQKIRDFEKRYGVKLPLELVEFYTSISNGCEMIDGFQLRAFESWVFREEKVSRPFPFDKYWIWEDDPDKSRLEDIENGVIELIDIGDCQTWNIVISGDQTGKMWFFTDVGIQPAAPSMTFLEWFSFWLDGNEDFFYGFEYSEGS